MNEIELKMREKRVAYWEKNKKVASLKDLF